MGGDSQPDAKQTQQFSGSSGATQGQSSGTTTQVLSSEQQQLLGSAMPYLQQFAATPPKMQGASETVAGFNPTQIASQTGALGAASGPMTDVVNSAVKGTNFLTSGAALDPSSNPALTATINAANRPIFDNLTETVLPGIRGTAASGGDGTMGANYGGSRQGIAEGIASKGALTVAGDNAARIATSGYTSGLDAMKAALGLAPGIAGSTVMPAATTGAVGDVQQGQTQREMDANNAAFNFNQWLPYIMGSALGGLATGLPGGSVSSTGQTSGSGYGYTSGQGTSTGTGTQTNPWQLGIGGALAGGSLMSGAAKLAPFLLSDERVKKDIRPLDLWHRELRFHEYTYVFEDTPRVGFIAQEVEKVRPDLVIEIGGLKLVNMEGALQ